MEIPHNAHVLVADGRKLLLFKNDGSVAAPKLNVATHREQDSAATQEQGADKPGQTQSSVGGVRSGYEQTDFHQQDEDRFAADAAEMLKRQVLAGRIEALIVIAAPRTLGELRKHYHHEVAKRVLGEIAKDVAGRPTDEIATVIANS
ncbi:MAG TPA: host attachment family protein [Caulobacteraceae bacterium]